MHEISKCFRKRKIFHKNNMNTNGADKRICLQSRL
jgi:hypothetical protein